MIWLVALIAFWVLLLSGCYVLVRAARLPTHRPERYLKPADPRRAPLVVCAGDSLTHGTLSFDFVSALRQRYPTWTILNAGVNGDLVENLRNRLEPIVAVDPDIVLVWIGVNDLLAEESTTSSRRYQWFKRLRQPPTYERFADHLHAIVQLLRERTKARVVLVAPPLLGEDFEAPIYPKLLCYRAWMRRLAAEEEVAFLDLTKAMEQHLKASSHRNRRGFHLGVREAWWLVKSPLLRYLLGMRWDRIAGMNRLYFSPDLIHLNERAGAVLMELLHAYFREPEAFVPKVGRETSLPPPSSTR